MKKLLTLILVFFALISKSQPLEYNTTFNNGFNNNYAKVWLPPTYYTNPNDSFQIIIFTTGAGEFGANYTGQEVHGPHAYKLRGGWDGGVVLGHGTYYPIIVSMQRLNSSLLQPPFSNTGYEAIINSFRARKKGVHLIGLSGGAWSSTQSATFQATLGDYSRLEDYTSFVNVQGVIPTDPYGATPPYATKFRFFALYGNKGHGGSSINFEQSQDGRNIANIRDTMNAARPGSAHYLLTSYGAGEHGYFENYFGNTSAPLEYNIFGKTQNIYQAVIRLGDTTLSVAGTPTANAGIDQSITLPTSTTTLIGSGNDPNGTITSYLWTKQSGPAGGAITSSTSATTGITALQQGAYVYRLLVTDNGGNTNFDEMNVVVNSSSTLTVSAGTNIAVNRKTGFIVLKGVVNQPTAVRTWRKLTTGIPEEIGHIIASTKDTTGATIFPYTNRVYQYELSATYLTETVKDTVDVNVSYGTTPPQSGNPAIRMATAGDIAAIPGAATGDAVIIGANETVSPNPGFNIDVYVNNPAGISVGPGRTIWVPAGQYNVITLNFDSNQVVGTLANPVKITNYGGQVEAVTLAVKNVTHTIVTGKYVAGFSGNVNFKGHSDGYAFSQGKYGIYLNSAWQSISKSSLVLSGKWNSNVTFEYIEAGNGNFAGIFIKDDDIAAYDYDSITVQNCYIHDNHGEGNYIGTTGAGLKQMFNAFKYINNRIIRAGNESFQFGKQNENNVVERNVFAFGAMNWRSTFERFNQAKGIQQGVQNGKNSFKNNLVRGSGDESFIAFSQSLDAKYASNNDTFNVTNNLFDYSKGFIGMYLGGTAPVANMKINLSNNLFARAIFKGDSAYVGTYGTNTQHMVRSQGGNYPLIFKNNIRDNSKNTYNITHSGTLDSSGNTVNASIPQPLFVNSGWADNFDYTKFEMWTDSLFSTWGNEYGADGGTRHPYIVVYQLNDYVTFLSKIYRSKVNNNRGNMPIGVTDTYWELQTWSDGVTTYNYPPDDYRLTSGDYYNARGMGLVDNLAISALPQPTVNSVTPISAASVEKYGKYETAISVTATYTNKYNFDAVNVYAIITSPTNLKDTIDAFWMDDYFNYDTTSHNLAPTGTPSFRLRYSPKEIGTYVGLVYVKDSAGTSSATAFNFISTSTTSKGFIRKNATNYLNFDNGSTFFAVGQNLAYTTGYLYPDYNKWMDTMYANNQNFARLWQTSDAFGMEWKAGLNLAFAQFEGKMQYEQRRAWAMDWAIGKAERTGIYLMLTQIVHNEYLTSNNGPRWADNPYNRINGGMCDSTIDFFRKPEAIKVFKNRLRYIIARYGYSKQIQAWELTNEINNTDGFYAAATRDSTRYYVREWKRTMANYIKAIDPNKHLVTSSYGGYDYNDHDSLTWHIPNMDISTWHWYDTARNPQKLAKEIDTKYIADFGKPTIQGEAGWSILQPSGFENIDSAGVQLHNLVWTSAFSGAFGIAMEWGWDDMIAYRKLNKHYKHIAAALNYFDLVAGNFKPYNSVTTFGATTQRTLTIIPRGNGFTLPVNDTAFTINDVGLLTPKETRLNHFVHGASANTQYRDPPTFTIPYPVNGFFTVDVDFVSAGGSNVIIYLDGVQVFANVASASTSYTIAVPAGLHTIKVDNTGQDWFYVKEYRFAKAGNPITPSALRSADGTKTVGLVLLEDNNWRWFKDSVGQPQAALNSNLRIPVPNGTYNVIYKSTTTNVTAGTQTVTVSNGLLESTIPALPWAMYYTIEPGIVTPVNNKVIRGLIRFKK